MSDSDDKTAAGEVTLLLQAVRTGDQQAASDLLPLVYRELRRLAGSRMRRLAPGQTLQPTALVHEAYLELVGHADPGWNGRAHFFGAAAQAMREILVDHARRKSRLKRGGDRRREVMHDDIAAAVDFDLPDEDVVALDRALTTLNETFPRQAEVVMLRFFAGLSVDAIADVQQVSARTVERDWRFARAWLHKEMGGPLESVSLREDA